MSNIKTWEARQEDDDFRGLSLDYAEQEIDDLRAALEEFEGEHSPVELQQMLDESFKEKQKYIFALGQQAKAIANLIAERDELRAALAPLQAAHPKSLAECATGKCDCDPHIEYCKVCAPGLFTPKAST